MRKSSKAVAIPVDFSKPRLWLSMFVLLVVMFYPALSKAQDLTKAHGFNFFGELKYPADFEHLDYVNPNAPKGGEISIWPRVHLIR